MTALRPSRTWLVRSPHRPCHLRRPDSSGRPAERCRVDALVEQASEAYGGGRHGLWILEPRMRHLRAADGHTRRSSRCSPILYIKPYPRRNTYCLVVSLERRVRRRTQASPAAPYYCTMTEVQGGPIVHVGDVTKARVIAGGSPSRTEWQYGQCNSRGPPTSESLSMRRCAHRGWWLRFAAESGKSPGRRNETCLVSRSF